MFNIRPWTLFLTSVFVSIFGIISHLVVVAELTSTTSVKVFRKRTKLNFVLQHPFFSVISENGQVRDVCVQKGVDGKLAWLETKNIHREEAVKSRWSLSDLKRKVSEQAGRFPKFQLFGAQEESRPLSLRPWESLAHPLLSQFWTFSSFGFRLVWLRKS